MLEDIKSFFVRMLIEKIQELPEYSVITTDDLLAGLGFNFNRRLAEASIIHEKLIEDAMYESIFLVPDRSDGAVNDLPFITPHIVSRRPLGHVFCGYVELLLGNDDLWKKFSKRVREAVPGKDPDFFAYNRDSECAETWQEMFDNMGGGLPLSLYEYGAWLILSYASEGHDIDEELEEIRRDTIHDLFRDDDINKITIMSESGYVTPDEAYSDRLEIMFDSIKYVYTPYVEAKGNPTWKWTYRTRDPAYLDAFLELEKLVQHVLDKEATHDIMDAGMTTIMVTYEDGRKEKREFCGLLYGEDQLLETLRKMIPCGKKTCPVILREYEDEEEE